MIFSRKKQEQKPQRFSSMSELLEHLRRSHRPHFVYRGQVRRWDEPLVPSIYRGMVVRRPCKYVANTRLRGLGGRFHEIKQLEEVDKSREKAARLNAQNYLRQIFGYPLSNLLCQQCGLQSEGLDVTRDPVIAAFFAKSDFRNRGFVTRSPRPGVIYRFEVPLGKPNLNQLKAYTVYDCPQYLDARDVLETFRTCESTRESAESLVEYNARFVPGRPKPFEVLRFPRDAIQSSRIVLQKAGLLLSDLLLPYWYQRYSPAPPAGKTTKAERVAVEDLHFRAGMEVFLFEHRPSDQAEMPRHPAEIFPEKDVFLNLLRSFLSHNTGVGQSMFMTEFGMLMNETGPQLLE